MAKTSKRKNRRMETVQPPARVYRAGIYVRVSSSKKEDSLQNQKDMINAFLATCDEEMVVCGIYKDNGKTGTNFERGGFLELLQDIRLRRINCVIVKDLSRFGRNYLEAGDYIEKIFPMLGVRFISVSEGIDTEKRSADTFEIKIRNLVNTAYAADISEKIAITHKLFQKEGLYEGGYEPYGYKRGTGEDICRLFPDPMTKDIVKSIFTVYKEERTLRAVLRNLAEKRVNPPMVYARTGKVYADEGEEYRQWCNVSICRILESRIYIGCLEQRKSTIRGKQEKNRIRYERENWIVHENFCEPLVSKELFQEVQKLRQESRNAKKRHSYVPKMEENLFQGIFFCGVCGRMMTRASNFKYLDNGKSIRKEVYECQGRYRYDSQKCVSNRIFRDELEKEILEQIDRKIREYGRGGDKAFSGQMKEKQRYENEKRRTLYAIGDLQCRQKKMYAAYISQTINKNTFQQENNALHKELTEVEEHLAGIEEDLKKLEIMELRKGKKSGGKQRKKLTPEMIRDLVDRVELYPGKKVQVFLRNPFDGTAGISEQNTAVEDAGISADERREAYGSC